MLYGFHVLRSMRLFVIPCDTHIILLHFNVRFGMPTLVMGLFSDSYDDREPSHSS